MKFKSNQSCLNKYLSLPHLGLLNSKIFHKRTRFQLFLSSVHTFPYVFDCMMFPTVLLICASLNVLMKSNFRRAKAKACLMSCVWTEFMVTEPLRTHRDREGSSQSAAYSAAADDSVIDPCEPQKCLLQARHEPVC